MELALEHKGGCAISKRNSVSILVIVELALELGPLEPLNREIISFNPCYRGTCSRTQYLCLTYWNSRNVSILVIVELALEPKSILGPF